MLGRPVVLLILPVILGTLTHCSFAQNTDSSSSSNSAPATANASTPSPKKIWTNDDVPPARAAALVAGKGGTTSRATPAQKVDAGTVQRIRKTLEKLQGQLDEVNKKLKIYKEFQAGEPVSTADREINKGVNRMPVDQQIVQLQDKKKQLEGQISDLYDEARQKGIDPGLLR